MGNTAQKKDSSELNDDDVQDINEYHQNDDFVSEWGFHSSEETAFFPAT